LNRFTRAITSSLRAGLSSPAAFLLPMALLVPVLFLARHFRPRTA
jgi:hypothetical protein